MTEEIVVSTPIVGDNAETVKIDPMLEKFNSVVSTLESALATVPKSAKNEVERMLLAEFVGSLKTIATANNRLIALGKALGIYQVEGNTQEIEALQAKIASVKAALKAANFEEDSEVVKGAIKGFTAELTKATSKVVDNQAQIAEFFGAKIGKARTTTEAGGTLATYRPKLSELKTTDYLFSQSAFPLSARML